MGPQSYIDHWSLSLESPCLFQKKLATLNVSCGVWAKILLWDTCFVIFSKWLKCLVEEGARWFPNRKLFLRFLVLVRVFLVKDFLQKPTCGEDWLVFCCNFLSLIRLKLFSPACESVTSSKLLIKKGGFCAFFFSLSLATSSHNKFNALQGLL